MVALASDFDVLGSRFLAGLTAILVAILCHAPAWQVRALLLLIGCHHRSPSFCLNYCCPCLDCSIRVSPYQGGGTTLPSFHPPADECSGCDAYPYFEGSFWRVAFTPDRIPTPKSTIAPVTIQCVGICIR